MIISAINIFGHVQNSFLCRKFIKVHDSQGVIYTVYSIKWLAVDAVKVHRFIALSVFRLYLDNMYTLS